MMQNCTIALSAWRQAQTDEVLDNPDPRGAA